MNGLLTANDLFYKYYKKYRMKGEFKVENIKKFFFDMLGDI